ncbi:MAG: PTS system mannose/fructose/sorbose family transporter subunit IID [Erysipelotrichaceae bacterium]|nr:PTS system mannose/fructose/sorbose family transporter subunit IID [Erysipelotrichaceae bacterium]
MAKKTISQEELTLLKKAYLGTCAVLRTTSSMAGEARAYVLTTAPFIERYYEDKEEAKKELYRQGTEYFNTHQATNGLIAGIVCALEKERGEKGPENFDSGIITGIKASLMGPLAGIGDSFFFNCYRVIIAGICIALSEGGNIFGPLLFVVLYGIGTMWFRWLFMKLGYERGSEFITQAFDSGIVPLLMKAAGILGAIMVGVLIATNMKVNIAFAPTINGAAINIQNMLDTILPGLMTLVVWWLVVKLLQKGASPIKITFGIMGVCIVLSLFGIL